MPFLVSWLCILLLIGLCSTVGEQDQVGFKLTSAIFDSDRFNLKFVVSRHRFPIIVTLISFFFGARGIAYYVTVLE